MSGTPPPILLFGGSFDPPHRAHIDLPLLAADATGADSVLFIPTKINPQKTGHPPTEPFHRLAMLEAALAHDPRAHVSSIELERPSPSYSVDTVRALRSDLGPDAPPLRFLIGADQALNFRSWREWRELERLAEPLVMPRTPHTLEVLPAEYERAFPGESARWIARTLDLPTEDASSTDVREASKHGIPLESIVPDVVTAYIRAHGLYGFGPERDTIA